MNVERQAELDAMRAQKDAAEAKVLALKAKKLQLAEKTTPFKMADVMESQLSHLSYTTTLSF